MRRTLAVVALLIACAVPARAGSITIYGMDLELTNLGLVDPLVPDGSYLFQLTLDTTGYAPPDGALLYGADWLKAIGIDFGTRISSASAISPTDWSIVTGQVTQGGCAQGGNDWACLSLASGDQILDGDTYTWLFALNFSGDAAYLPDSTASVDIVVSGLRLKPNGGTLAKTYVSPAGALDIEYNGAASSVGDEQLPAVPEPGTLTLLAVGAFCLWGRKHVGSAPSER